MNVEFLRASSASTYDDCQFKYFLEYVLGLDSGVNKKAYLGTISHHVLELLARFKKNNKTSSSKCNAEYLLNICWDRYKDEEEEIELDDKDYKFCRKTIDKVLKSSFNPLKLNIIKTEQTFKIPIGDERFRQTYYDIITKEKKDVWWEIRGTADLLYEENPETLHILDWKTGKGTCWVTGKLKDSEYLEEKDIQARMYALAASILYPQYKFIMLTIYYINDQGPVTATYTKEDHAKTIDMLYEKFIDITENYLPSRIKEEKRGQLWKCKHVCGFGHKSRKCEDGPDLCDKIHEYMVHHSMPETIKEVNKLMDKKKKKNVDSNNNQNKTSNRRNAAANQ